MSIRSTSDLWNRTWQPFQTCFSDIDSLQPFADWIILPDHESRIFRLGLHADDLSTRQIAAQTDWVISPLVAGIGNRCSARLTFNSGLHGRGRKYRYITHRSRSGDLNTFLP